MADGPMLHMRLDPAAEHDLDALARRLNLTRSAVIRLALRRLAQLEGVEPLDIDPDAGEGKAAA